LSVQAEQWHEQLRNPACMYHVCHIQLKSKSLQDITLLEPVWLEELCNLHWHSRLL